MAGAQLASYAAYLANADVALSIVLTSLTTMISVAATPLLSQLLIGSVVPVDAVAMSKSILQVQLMNMRLYSHFSSYSSIFCNFQTLLKSSGRYFPSFYGPCTKHILQVISGQNSSNNANSCHSLYFPLCGGSPGSQQKPPDLPSGSPSVAPSGCLPFPFFCWRLFSL